MPPKRKQQYRHLPAFILLALAEEPVHGGALLTALTRRMPLFKADSAAVYRTLQQLEDEAQVVSSWDTSGSGPARRVYRLTHAGWEKLEGWRQDIEMRMAHLRYFLETYAECKRQRGEGDDDAGGP